MKCEKAQELFSDHLEDALERPMAVAFERHLAECPGCEREYASFKTTWQMLESLPAVDVPPGFATNVVMAVRIQQDAARRAKPRWRAALDEMFTSRVPVKVFAAAVAILLGVQVVLNTPLKGVVGAWIVGGIATDSAPMKWQTKGPAEAWLNSALSFELAGSRDTDGRSVFRLLLKPKGVTSEHVRVFLMPSGQPRFNQGDMNQASLIFDDNIEDSGRILPFVLGGDNGQHDVITALVEWEYRQRQFREAVFVPIRMGDNDKSMPGSIQLRHTELYSALQQVSAAFGVVILAQADVSATVEKLDIKDGYADDALYKLTKSVSMRYRPLGGQVYSVERRFE